VSWKENNDLLNTVVLHDRSVVDRGWAGLIIRELSDHLRSNVDNPQARFSRASPQL
jgi:hypothetical protein